MDRIRPSLIYLCVPAALSEVVQLRLAFVVPFVCDSGLRLLFIRSFDATFRFIATTRVKLNIFRPIAVEIRSDDPNCTNSWSFCSCELYKWNALSDKSRSFEETESIIYPCAARGLKCRHSHVREAQVLHLKKKKIWARRNEEKGSSGSENFRVAKMFSLISVLHRNREPTKKTCAAAEINLQIQSPAGSCIYCLTP